MAVTAVRSIRNFFIWVWEEARQKRARLKIFFGAAPGVGKTYSMLTEAQKLLLDGVDVVAGIVETHGRPETSALTAGLEFL